MKPHRKCWCGNADLLPFDSGYGKCGKCGTLVSLVPVSAGQFVVTDDEKDFYGKGYWLARQESRGYPPIDERARTDLTDRNLRWLELLLKYRLPPAAVLEIGCAHGSFVALMRHAGYDASGIEMSPWVVDFGKRSFAAPIQVGAVETLEFPRASFDVVVLMDVIEHLSDPAMAIGRCAELLRSDGFLLIQTPCFDESSSLAALMKSESLFLKMMIPDEHIYLFGRQSLPMLLRSAGLTQVSFEPAVFPYDMMAIGSREPLHINAEPDIESALLATPGGRIALALLDIGKRELASIRKLETAESDRAAHGEQVEKLSRMLRESEADRTARLGIIERLEAQARELQARLEASEADRAARLEAIERLDAQRRELQARLETSEADRAARLEAIERLDAQGRELQGRLETSEADRTMRLEVIERLDTQGRELQARLETSEADRAARLEVIERLDAQVRELQGRLEISESDRAARLAVIKDLDAHLKTARSELERLSTLRGALVHAWKRVTTRKSGHD